VADPAIDEDVLNKHILPQIPVGRLGEPQEIARSVVFLASDDAGFINGTTISANGGSVLQLIRRGTFQGGERWARAETCTPNGRAIQKRCGRRREKPLIGDTVERVRCLAFGVLSHSL
jgi:hypothetical protein